MEVLWNYRQVLGGFAALIVFTCAASVGFCCCWKKSVKRFICEHILRRPTNQINPAPAIAPALGQAPVPVPAVQLRPPLPSPPFSPPTLASPPPSPPPPPPPSTLPPSSSFQPPHHITQELPSAFLSTGSSSSSTGSLPPGTPYRRRFGASNLSLPTVCTLTQKYVHLAYNKDTRLQSFMHVMLTVSILHCLNAGI